MGEGRSEDGLGGELSIQHQYADCVSDAGMWGNGESVRRNVPKEVAERLAAGEGNKDYGITSILLQAYYDCEYVFTVHEDSFNPPPKVKSGVIDCRLKSELPTCDYGALKLVVKTAFSQRRKTLGNALKPLTTSRSGFVLPDGWSGMRAEQLGVRDYLKLAQIWVENS